jgi:hypothetical protein
VIRCFVQIINVSACTQRRAIAPKFNARFNSPFYREVAHFPKPQTLEKATRLSINYGRHHPLRPRQFRTFTTLALFEFQKPDVGSITATLGGDRKTMIESCLTSKYIPNKCNRLKYCYRMSTTRNRSYNLFTTAHNGHQSAKVIMNANPSTRTRL